MLGKKRGTRKKRGITGVLSCEVECQTRYRSPSSERSFSKCWGVKKEKG